MPLVSVLPGKSFCDVDNSTVAVIGDVTVEKTFGEFVMKPSVLTGKEL